MGSKYQNTFFDAKREWSKYKDSILDYYLVPYLQKVKYIGRPVNKPICIVDMFAGRGEFKSGEKGSPLIIAEHLDKLSKQGFSVQLVCYEHSKEYHEHLVSVLKPYPFAEAFHQDCFSDIAHISKIASTHTTLLYIDPCDVTQLLLHKLKLVFDRVLANQSVEALIVFMASAFMRHAAWVRNIDVKMQSPTAEEDLLFKELLEGTLHDGKQDSQQEQKVKSQLILSSIVGGDFWQEIVADEKMPWEERVAFLVDKYREKLKGWFNTVEAVPIRPDHSTIPKYWMAFMSRYEPAFDLFNDAACDMNRARIVSIDNRHGSLFSGIEAEPEGANPSTVDRDVKRELKSARSITWDRLRWNVCGNRNVGKYTVAEVNQSIKRLIKAKLIMGALGNKVEGANILKPAPQLDSWIDR